MIGDLREKLSKRLRVSMGCLWIVDKENGTVYHDDTKIESSKIKRYSLMIGNMHRTKEFDENEDGNVETDVINNRHITKGKIRMRCGHFTGKFFVMLFLSLRPHAPSIYWHLLCLYISDILSNWTSNNKQPINQ